MQKVTELAPQLWPLLAPRVSNLVEAAINASLAGGASSLTGGTTPAGGSMQVHALSSTWHTGNLADSQAPQFLMTNGSRPLVGNLSVNAGVTIDGVDLSLHVADPDAHHTRVITIPPLRVVTLQQLALDYLNGLQVVSNMLEVALAPDSGLTFLSGKVALGTPALVSTTSTSGLIGVVHSHAAEWSSNPGPTSKLLGSDSSGYLTLVRLMGTDRLRTPLLDSVTGGISIQANTTVTVEPEGDILLNPGSNLVKLEPTKNFQSHNYASQLTGMRITNDGQGDFRYIFVDELHAKAFIADLEQALAGGQIISKSVAVLAKTFTAPGTSTTTVTYRSHTTTTSTTASIAGGKPAGLQIEDFLVAHLVHPTSSGVPAVPDGWVLLNSWADAFFTTYRIYHKYAGVSEPDTYTWTFGATDESLLTITAYSGVNQLVPINAYGGGTQGLNSSTNAPIITTTVNNCVILIFSAFVEETDHGNATATPGTGITERADYLSATRIWGYYGEAFRPTAGNTPIYFVDFTGNHRGGTVAIAIQPSTAGVTALTVRDLPSAANMAVFQSGDIVMLRQFTRSGGSLTIGNCWGVVTNYSDGTASNSIGDGNQQWTFTRSSAPNAGIMAEGTQVLPDSIVLDFGTSGNGYYEVNAIDGMYGANSPYMQIVTWTGHPHTGKVLRARLGNLYGIFSVANEYGLYAGSGTANSDSYVRISSNIVKLNNIPLTLWNGATQTTNFNAAGTDIWIGLGSADKRLSWNGSLLTVRGAIIIQAGSSGIGTFSDAGVLATVNNLDGVPDGGTFVRTTIPEKTGAGRAYNTIDGTGTVITRFDPATNWGANPGAGLAGLLLGADYMGYWNGTVWKTYLDSTGRFYFGGNTGASLRWDGTKLSGYDSGNTEQWYAGSTDGKITAGAGNLLLGADGLRFLMVDSPQGYNELKWAFNASASPEFRILSIRDGNLDVYSAITSQAKTAGKQSTLTISSYRVDATPGILNFTGYITFNQTTNTLGAAICSSTLTVNSTLTANAALVANTLNVNNSGTFMGAFNQGSNANGYGYFDFNYAGTRMGYLLWRVGYVQLVAEGRPLYIAAANVGINRGDPGYNLDVLGEFRVTGTVRADVALSLAAQGTAPGASTVYYILYIDAADGKLKYRIPSGSGGTIRTLTYT